MKQKKLRVGILFGGRSAEHEVSLQSAKNIIEAIDKDKYDPVLIGIDKSGKWHLQEKSQFLLNETNPKLIALNRSSSSVTLSPWHSENNLKNIGGGHISSHIDVVFPVLHGPYGEDGTIQGLLKLAGIPFIGASVLGSAIGMDKDVMKRLLLEARIPVTKFLVFTERDRKFLTFESLKQSVGIPFFVKPANLGSSVGVWKVSSGDQFAKARDDAFSYDTKILVEQYIKGLEIECSVLGNEDPIVSVAGEVVPTKDFYSYDAKYVDQDAAKLVCPADLEPKTLKKIQDMALRAYKTLCCEGMARVDFFVTKYDTVFVNEINTIPGFTKISMYPKLWQESGIGYTELIDRLITLAIERYEKEQKLNTTRNT